MTIATAAIDDRLVSFCASLCSHHRGNSSPPRPPHSRPPVSSFARLCCVSPLCGPSPLHDGASACSCHRQWHWIHKNGVHAQQPPLPPYIPNVPSWLMCVCVQLCGQRLALVCLPHRNRNTPGPGVLLKPSCPAVKTVFPREWLEWLDCRTLGIQARHRGLGFLYWG
jgi:hypothetical protein